MNLVSLGRLLLQTLFQRLEIFTLDSEYHLLEYFAIVITILRQDQCCRLGSVFGIHQRTLRDLSAQATRL